MSASASDLKPAPGELDVVRRLLNTERLDDASGEWVDQLPALLATPEHWPELFPELPAPAKIEALVTLRADLRALLSTDRSEAQRINRWLERFSMDVRAMGVDGELQLRYVTPADAGTTGEVLRIVLESIQDGSWARLKACPGCGWVFYDFTRSKTKVWCRMVGGPDGRGCGTLSKVRRYRARQRDLD